MYYNNLMKLRIRKAVRSEECYDGNLSYECGGWK